MGDRDERWLRNRVSGNPYTLGGVRSGGDTKLKGWVKIRKVISQIQIKLRLIKIYWEPVKTPSVRICQVLLHSFFRVNGTPVIDSDGFV